MKIISWNVNGIRAALKKGLPEFVKRENPDILCLQETKASPEQVAEPDRSLGLGQNHWASAQKKGYSGVATFLKTPAKDAHTGLGIEKFDSEGRVVVSVHPQFELYNVYFPNGARGKDRHEYKLDFYSQFAKHLSARLKKGANIIVLGDYNIAPAEIDIYDPIKHAKTSGFLPEEREVFAQFLDLGFVDTFRHLHPTEKNRFSWWNQIERARIGNRGWRIDMICISKGLVPALKKADILDQVEGSDHCPVTVELEF